MRNLKRSILLVWLLGLVGCGEPVVSRVEPPPLAMPQPSTAVQPTESVAELDEADVRSVKPRSADDPVAASFSVPQNALRAGDTFEVSVDFEIALSYEIQDRNSLPPAVSTLIELNLPAGFEAIEDWSDPTSFRSELPDSHMVYAGKATFTRKVRIGNAVAPGQYALSCLFRYQACNARQCLRPVESRLAVSLTIQESQTKTHPLRGVSNADGRPDIRICAAGGVSM